MAKDSAELIPVSQLQERYNIKRSALYNRLSALELQPTKVGRRAFITPADVVRLDALGDHIEAGGTIHDFTEQPSSVGAGALTVAADDGTAPMAQNTNFATFLDAFSTRPDPLKMLLNRLDLLEKAATHEWLLPTSDLSMALGLSRRSVGKYPKFERYGFVFTKVGQMGTETSWRVQKAAKPKKKFKR
ncbi:hypothetical protein [Acaryochloris sp. CCMEE 5410]|uniref:hypothetical protein n=1 Tax=Acaryochloris sp. CCMEE 5410 TaxID=310037 RepID=UPI0002483C60|nr:hypothetical protein [Acaryochloris sp. CCMEE 5410]KAI9131042.1 hypothetical protein ON05_025520 [Acaryochloris sp. CCMEE 5410]